MELVELCKPLPAPKKRKSLKSKKTRNLIIKIVTYVLIAILSIAFLLPFFWMLSSAFKPVEELTYFDSFIPKNPTWDNFKGVFKLDFGITIWRSFLNTILIVVPSTIIGCLTAGLAAFAFAKIPFKGRDTIFFIFIATMAIPGIVLMIPSYMLFTKIGWVNTWLPLMIPGMMGGAGAIFFTRQFMRGIPKDIEDAARIDGLSWWGIFWRVELPLSKPILISNFIFGFLGGYNDWLGPELYLSGDDSLWTLQKFISQIAGSAGLLQDTGVQMAASCLALIPTFVIFVLCQRQFLEGINLNGGKD